MIKTIIYFIAIYYGPLVEKHMFKGVNWNIFVTYESSPA